MTRLLLAVRAFWRHFYRPEPTTTEQVLALYALKNRDAGVKW